MTAHVAERVQLVGLGADARVDHRVDGHRIDVAPTPGELQQSTSRGLEPAR